MILKNCAFVAAACTAVVAGSAFADSTGEIEYMNSCASCHGIGGKGMGPVSEVLSVVAPPLTDLSADNDGVFPMLETIQIIDGRTGVRGHGTEGMPVWGAVYKAPMEETVGSYGSEIAVRGRILSLALYLESIQE